MIPSPAPLLLPALSYLDQVGIAVFAVSGALVAAQKRQTLVTFVFFAVVTGIGGGTLRDLLLDAPVFWIGHNRTLLICVGAALLVWFTRAGWWGGRSLAWFDAAGLVAYATFGTAKALALGAAHLPALGLGVLTACAGGILRDLLAGEPSILLRPELYVTAAALSAGLMVVLTIVGLPALPAGTVAAMAGFTLRGLAISRHWSLPSYNR